MSSSQIPGAPLEHSIVDTRKDNNMEMEELLSELRLIKLLSISIESREVYKGIFENKDEVVAMKRLQRYGFCDLGENALNLFRRLRNRSLQSPRSTDGDDHCCYLPWRTRLCIALENAYTRLCIALEEAYALCYKIAATPPIPMDLRPSNILPDGAKLSDFGRTHNSPWDVKFAVTTSAKGGTEIRIGSNVIHVRKYSSVHHPLAQMVLFACHKFDDSFSCLKSISPKNIYDMAKRLSSPVWTIMCGTDWISASRKSDSPKMGTISEFDTMNNIGWRKEPTENQSHHSDPDSSQAEHGIKAVGRMTPAAWVVATGAPHHATGDRGLLSGFITEHNDQFVHAADGVPMKVLARGAIVTDAFVLPDVWFVPGLTANLVSVSQLSELDYSVGFDCGECCVSAAGKVVGKAHLQDGGLYVLDFLKVPLAI